MNRPHQNQCCARFGFFVLAICAFGSLRAQTSSSTLLQFDFNSPTPWKLTSAKPGEPGILAGPFGTVDVADGVEPSGGLLLSSDGGDRDGWITSFQSGPLPWQNTETNPGKLTLSFDLAATRALPVRVLLESFDQKKKRTGGLETLIYPAAEGFYQRYALDLSIFRPTSSGQFDPTAPSIGISYEISSSLGWPTDTHHELRLDNVHFAKPAFYVSPQGRDEADGLSETTAFATPQRALEAAQPGDIVVLMEGNYTRAAGMPEKTPVARFVRSGTPAGWITLKNFPGQTPVLSSHGQTAVSLAVPRKGEPNDTLILSYLEVRGMHILGNGATAREQFPAELGKATPNTQSAGIAINGRRVSFKEPRTPGELVHHIRIADNLVDFCTGDGIYAEYADWLYLEHNIVQNNCWTSVGYAPAGLAVMGFANFDRQDNIPKMLIAGNRVSGNKLTVKNQPYEKATKTSFFNGNGILLDGNAEKPEEAYFGRTLVQNNLVFNNGGGGIQMWANHRMDLINNTVYLNGTVLPWGQIGFERCRDVRLVNNLIIAGPDGPLDSWMVKRPDGGTHRIQRLNNFYQGGVRANISGINDRTGDPLFVRPAAEPGMADFHLQSGSPARHAGRWETFMPGTDLDGTPRPASGSPGIGAYE